MKIKYLSLAAAFAVAAASAFANAVDTDLVIGFKEGTMANLELDLGSYANLIAGTSTVNGSSVTYDLGNLNSLLTTNYGSSWATTSTLVYGVVGTMTDAVTTNVTNWLTSKWTTTTGTLGVQNSVAFGTSYDSVLGGTNSKIATMYQASFTGSQNSAVVASSLTTSWYKTDPFNTAVGKIDATVVNGSTDLYTVTSDGTSGTYSFLGTFNLSSTGELTYTTLVAIPEPSTYAMILGALTVGFVALRRRFSRTV